MIDLVRAVRRGEARLWVAYWLWGVGGNMALLAVLVAAYVAWAPVWALWGVWGLGVAWHFLVTWPGVRACGKAYPGPRVWPWLADFGCWLGIPRLAGEAWAVLVLA